MFGNVQKNAIAMVQFANLLTCIIGQNHYHPGDLSTLYDVGLLCYLLLLNYKLNASQSVRRGLFLI